MTPQGHTQSSVRKSWTPNAEVVSDVWTPPPPLNNITAIFHRASRPSSMTQSNGVTWRAADLTGKTECLKGVLTSRRLVFLMEPIMSSEWSHLRLQGPASNLLVNYMMSPWITYNLFNDLCRKSRVLSNLGRFLSPSPWRLTWHEGHSHLSELTLEPELELVSGNNPCEKEISSLKKMAEY